MGNFNTKNKLALGAILAIILIMLGVWQGFYFSGGIFDRPTTPTPTIIISPSKTIRSSSLPLKEIWRWKGSVDDYYSSIRIVIQGKQLFLYSSDGGLYAFDIVTGNIDWVKEIWNVRYVTANSDGVYVDKQGQVIAFQLKTGEPLWSKTFYTGHGFLLDIYAQENILEVFFNGVHILASQTGEEQEKVSYDTDWRPVFFIRGNTLYLTVGNYLSAHSIEFNEDLWTSELDSTPKRWPIFEKNKMIVQTQQINALNIDTGDAIWQTPKPEDKMDSAFEIYPNTIVSNIAIGDNIIYAITMNDFIVGYDADTGKEMGTIEVSKTDIVPAQLEMQSSIGTGYHLLAASDKYVAAYYGDSQELIVFERTDMP